MNKEWKPARGKYASGEELWIGDRICVGNWFNPIGRQGERLRYRVTCHLPDIGIKEEFVVGDDLNRQKAILERVVDRWFERANWEPVPEGRLL